MTEVDWKALGFTIERSVAIGASPADVYELVADVTHVGRISPECVEATWSSGTPGQMGSRFTGRNVVGESTWSMECEVIAARRPDVFSWRVLTEAVTPDTSVWTFTFEPASTGTKVTETFTMSEPPAGFQASLAQHDAGDRQLLIGYRKARLTLGIEATLANLRTLAEGSGNQRPGRRIR